MQKQVDADDRMTVEIKKDFAEAAIASNLGRVVTSQVLVYLHVLPLSMDKYNINGSYLVYDAWLLAATNSMHSATLNL